MIIKLIKKIPGCENCGDIIELTLAPHGNYYELVTPVGVYNVNYLIGHGWAEDVTPHTEESRKRKYTLISKFSREVGTYEFGDGILYARLQDIKVFLNNHENSI